MPQPNYNIHLPCIDYYPDFVCLGSDRLALVFSVLYEWHLQSKGGWFYADLERWRDWTGLQRRALENSRAKLRRLRVIAEKRMGDHGRLHVKINLQRLKELLDQNGVAYDPPAPRPRLVIVPDRFKETQPKGVIEGVMEKIESGVSAPPVPTSAPPKTPTPPGKPPAPPRFDPYARDASGNPYAIVEQAYPELVGIWVGDRAPGALARNRAWAFDGDVIRQVQKHLSDCKKPNGVVDAASYIGYRMQEILKSLRAGFDSPQEVGRLCSFLMLAQEAAANRQAIEENRQRIEQERKQQAENVRQAIAATPATQPAPAPQRYTPPPEFFAQIKAQAEQKRLETERRLEEQRRKKFEPYRQIS